MQCNASNQSLSPSGLGLQTTDGTQLVCQLTLKLLPGTLDITRLIPSPLKALANMVTLSPFALLQVQDSGGHPR